MSEQPQGLTGEQCKAAGTYVSEAGVKHYFDAGDSFSCCPQTGRDTHWKKVT